MLIGPSQECFEDRPGTVPSPLTNQLLSIIQALIQQDSLNQAAPTLNDNKSASESKTMVARERFELSSAHALFSYGYEGVAQKHENDAEEQFGYAPWDIRRPLCVVGYSKSMNTEG